MKKTQEVIGLPIISISDGMEVGKVKSIIINADKGAIDYIVVDSGIQILSARVIPTDSILGIGEYALTIENENSINDISKIPAAIDLLQKNIQVKGTKVLTKKGRLIGEIGDIYVDENENCRIIGLEYIADITQKKIRLIPRDNVITFGKNLVVVTDDVEVALVDRPTQLGFEEKSAEVEKKNLVNYTSPSPDRVQEVSQFSPVETDDELVKADSIIAASGDELYRKAETELTAPPEENIYQQEDTSESAYVEEEKEFTQPVQDIIEEASEMVESSPPSYDSSSTVEQASAPVDNNASNLFEQKQRQYLKGRRASKTITDNSGNIIVTEGSVISDDIIDVAKVSGKLIELVMNNKA